tara:strand:+ start:1959 stop:2414 length:456 start_codon:yes stop_codon:yes gene_type:complete
MLKLQTMNKIKFLVCNISTTFPSDINEIIFKKVQENAAESIQRMYYLRVRINLDALLIFNQLSRWGAPPQSYQTHPSEIKPLNKKIAFYSSRIRYSYIQEPGTWIYIMYDICNRCMNYDEFKMHKVYYIIDNIRNSNHIYAQTGIEWWENF